MKKFFSTIIILLLVACSSKNATYQISHPESLGSIAGIDSQKRKVTTTIYKAQMEVAYSGKKANIEISYSLIDNEQVPTVIYIGDMISNDKKITQQQVEKLKAIGLTKEEFQTKITPSFKQIIYL